MTQTIDTKPDIVVVLESYGVTVRGGGSWIPVRCPFHGDSTASASVHPDYGKFFCHGCEVRGDAWDLIREREGCDLKEAIEIGKQYAQATARPDQRRTVRKTITSTKSWTPPGRRGRQ